MTSSVLKIMKWSNLIVFLFLSEVTYAQKWELENIISVKQMCLQASAIELLQTTFNKDVNRILEKLYVTIESVDVLNGAVRLTGETTLAGR